MKFATTLSIILIGFSGFSQLSSTTSSELNTNCNGTDCNYSGPTILINELMISPTVNDGSISGFGGASEGRGEWIELYNPNLCESIDISCYYLGNNTSEGNGGFVIPAGTIVPPSGYCMIRGMNVPAVPSNLLVANGGNVVEVIVPYEIPEFVRAEPVCGSRMQVAGLRFMMQAEIHRMPFHGSALLELQALLVFLP